MTSEAPSVADEIARYLRTGNSDPYHAAWPGHDFVDGAQRANADLSGALVAEVLRRTNSWQPPADMIAIDDFVALTRRRVAPMVRGLFPRVEQDAVLRLVERSVVFLTPGNIEEVLCKESAWLRSAWVIANLYLGAIGAELLSDHAPRIVGVSQGATCYVSPKYFEEKELFSDFVVHEVAHIFHNYNRRKTGLPETRYMEWLLNIEYRKRETFAYACEAYACVLRRSRSPKERIELAAEIDDDFGTQDERVSYGEIADIVRNAATRRNGWKLILQRCAPPKRGSPRRVSA